MKSKHIFSMVLVLVLIFSLVTGCNKADNNDEQEKTAAVPRSIVISSPEWQGADTAQITATYSSQNLIADPLLNYETDGSLTSNVAKSYNVSPDGLTVTIEMPDDLKFHDGTSVTPNDVKFSFEYFIKVSPFADDFAAVKSVEVSGNNVIVSLSTPSTTLLFNLGSNIFPILKEADSNGKTKEQLLWGTTVYGAFYVDEYVAGDHVTLKKNPYYKTYNQHVINKGAMNVETITVRFIKDTFANVQGMLSGEIANVEGLSADVKTQLADNPDIVTDWESQPSVARFEMNNDFELFKDPDIRLAMMLLIDREKTKVYSNGNYEPVYSYSVSGMTDYSSSAEEYFKAKYVNDAKRALQILSDKGWNDSDGDGFLDRNGKKFEFTVSLNNNAMKNLAECLQIVFKEKGIKMNLNYMDTGAFRNLFKSDTHEAAISLFQWGDTAGTLPYIVKDKNIFDSKAYDEILQEAITTADKEKRMAGYTKAQQMLMDSRCNLPLVRVNSLLVYNQKSLPNFKVINNIPYFNDVR
ncbi:hypothetical protein AN963_06595 [Brevibacillus choshinensis]|uniref:Solute-binding protein family 5 domain-containing protein n=1 Tax=Brevibacillus choshinensis TaxID=54911 RepID=A0ABR5ND34_BRECH|nr:ABC transporter substrate-binding protein [Brevibacillus choshinensis]KQL49418.1 hypothetical protein AN963_06595 [Brevibacillus choshinensis]